MKILALSAFSLLTSLLLNVNLVQAQAVGSGTISWTASPQVALRQARETGLPILAFFTSENCTYCQKMEREVWGNRRIISQVEAETIPLRIQAEHHPQFVNAVGIQAFPTTVFFSPDGKVLAGSTGFAPATKIVGMLDSVNAPRQAHP